VPDLNSTPTDDSVRAFVDAVANHDKVLSATRRRCTYLVDVRLKNGPGLLVHVTNIYVVGVADVQEVLTEHADVKVLVTLSKWNMVSDDARDYGRERMVGVFTWSDFFGALNYKKYWLYEQLPMDIDRKDVGRERQRRRRVWN
jgi:hypothetical protein